MSPKSSRLKKLFFSIFTLIIFLAILNFALRPAVNHRAVDQYEGLYIEHPQRLLGLKPGAELSAPVGVFGPYEKEWKKANLRYSIKINSLGFRDREFKKLPTENTFRIICIGDSSTFGWDVVQGQAYPKIVEKMLTARFPDKKLEVLNCGVPGYSSHQAHILLEQTIWNLHPDLLVVAFGRNDELDTAFAPTSSGINRTDKELMPIRGGNQKTPQRKFMQVIRDLPVYRFALKFIVDKKSRKVVDAGGIGKNYKDVQRRVSIEDYERNLEWIVRKAKRKEIPVVLLAVGMFFEDYRKVLQKVGQKEGIPAIDMFPILLKAVPEIRTREQFEDCRSFIYEALGKELVEESEGGWLYFSTDYGHPNWCGHRIIAETLSPEIIKMNPEKSTDQ